MPTVIACSANTSSDPTCVAWVFTHYEIGIPRPYWDFSIGLLSSMRDSASRHPHHPRNECVNALRGLRRWRRRLSSWLQFGLGGEKWMSIGANSWRVPLVSLSAMRSALGPLDRLKPISRVALWSSITADWFVNVLSDSGSLASLRGRGVTNGVGRHASKLHLVSTATACRKRQSSPRYSAPGNPVVQVLAPASREQSTVVGTIRTERNLGRRLEST